ncbi:flavin-dependent dehydrogenase [Trichothermofontia sichuanensis B231]|uniref:NAD(P)/FAD-dependent oxidoreductase n=1 Tax=Trichothermofontia sichuanensis TaxID=3045816 RepID=UPI002248509D|nr:flavin-dependent dehydrogenase [Trichothermofontia sichuanensis]UZQ54149.1 flavin-dependent dehydrogenase [Trichothermofontia sichuanensis B231]
MQEVLYLEIPTPDTVAVRDWLQQHFAPQGTEQWLKVSTPTGIRLQRSRSVSAGESLPTMPPAAEATEATDASLPEEVAIFVWSLQRTTYLKAFRWAERSLPGERQMLAQLTQALRQQFPHHYPEPPAIDLSQQSIFEALAAHYPKTVEYFRKFPNGEYGLTRAYWWEQRWREGVRNPQSPRQVVFSQAQPLSTTAPTYDLIYIGGALGVIHAAAMAQLGYRVLLIERMPFGRMNREWNISRDEFQRLIDLGLFTAAEFESVIAREYIDGFHKFFDANNPPQAKAPILHTPTVLNIAVNSDKLIQLCGEKLRAAGGEIWDETEFERVDVDPTQVTVQTRHLGTQAVRSAQGRLLVDAMGTASPIAWQLNNGRAFDSVCPTVGAVFSGLEPEVWDSRYGDVLNSHGDISRGRQLIWELFPVEGEDLTVYLFHYHQIHPDNPGSLLEMYEDFFTIFPEYRRCDLDKLTWKKPTFGYIPGYFTTSERDRQVAFDRLIAIGDAASLQSPLIFTGFGSLVRNLGRLTDLLDTALKHDLLSAKHLNQIRAYQSNLSVTWLFSKGMMVPTGKFLPPERINAMLNTFFGILANTDPQVAERFMKDQIDWWTFNRLALTAASQNPAMLLWIWELAGPQDMLRWLKSYWDFTVFALLSWCFGWLPGLTRRVRSWLEPRNPSLWFWLLTQSYRLTSGMGQPPIGRFSDRDRPNSNPSTPPIGREPSPVTGNPPETR